MRPTKLSGNKNAFRDVFHDRGGIIAEIIEGGVVRIGSEVIPRVKDY